MGKTNAYKVLGTYSKGKTGLWKLRCEREDNIKMELQEIGCWDVN
jgi:hypothetical protein